MFRRIVALAAGMTIVALSVGGQTLAHIDPDPTEAQAGVTLSVGFTVEHGCDGSPTTQLDMRLPDGVTDAAPDPIEGWDGSIDENVVTFVGGPLADDVEETFAVTMTLPATPDTTIYFPFVQRCEEGEIRWIGIPAEPGDELDEPAPALLLMGPAVITTTPVTTDGPGEPAVPPTTPPVVEPTTPVVTEAVADTASTVPGTTVPATNPDEVGSSNTGTIIFIVSILAVFAVGGLAYLRSRSAGTSS